jgi:hypothetical protein
MALDLEKVRVSKEEKEAAEEVLANLPTLNRTLVQPKMTLDAVRVLIKVEADHRHRMTTLQRLVARYNVLEAKQNEEDLMAYVTDKVKGLR